MAGAVFVNLTEVYSTCNELHQINNLIKTLVQEVKTLKEDLKVSNLKVKNLEIENARLKRATNLTLFKLNAL